MVKGAGRAARNGSADAFLTALRSLKASGPNGFEGLVADLLSALTGELFRLLKSGPQGGVDALQISQGNGIVVGLEGKRYGEKTKLGIDALKAKLIDAVDTYQGLDMWVLAASREVTADDRHELCALGDSQGIAVEIIDWPSSPAGLPPLAVLCAAAPQVIKAHLNGDFDYLQALGKHPEFETACAQLRGRLTAPDVGYAAARRCLALWIRNAFRNQATARSRVGSFANLLDPSLKLVRRPALNDTLDGWIEKRSDVPLVLLGDEGLGKTWAALAWWQARAGSAGDDLPLTFVIPARAVDTTDVQVLLARFLAECTMLRNAEFWQRRLRLWRGEPCAQARPKILVIIDGLNENWMFKDWAALLQPLFADDWRGQVAVILTCRPDHWRNDLKQLGDLRPPSEEVLVERFSDPELDELLSAYGLRRGDFAGVLLGLMRVPRLCQLAIRYRGELEASGDVTAERLIFEDWKERLHIHGALIRSTDEGFRSFIAELGRRVHEQLQSTGTDDVAITRREIIEQLGRDSGEDRQDLGMTVSEIVDGRWLEPAGDHRFRLQRDSAPFALALALVDDLKTVSPEGVPDRIAEFFDPIRGGDFGAAILRAASTFTLLDQQSPTPLRRCLVEAWLASQNFRRRDFDSFWRLIGADPHLFLDLAREFWLRRGFGVHEDEVLIKAFANAYQWSPVAEALQQRAVEWLSQYWPDPDAGAFLNYRPNTPKALEHREATFARRTEWDRVSTKVSGSLPLCCVTEGDPSWFAHRAIGILSFLPRRPFVRAFVGWAVSRAIMGRPRHFDQLAWILRWNPHDAEAIEADLSAEAERLLSMDHPISSDAARWLLEALATPSALARAPQVAVPERSHRSHWPSTVGVKEDTREVRWDHRAAVQWPRCRDAPLAATMGLARFALDPATSLPPEDREVLEGLASQTRADRIRTHWGQGDDDIAVEHSDVALARWAPKARANLLRRIFASASHRDSEALRQLALEVPHHVLILGDEERCALADARQRGMLAGAGDTRRDEYVRLDLVVAELADKPAGQQIGTLSTLPGGPNLDQKDREILATPTTEDFAAMAPHLSPGAPQEQIARWLWYLTLAPLENMPAGYAPLAALIQHRDQRVRSLALEVIYRSGDEQLATALARSGWEFSPKMESDEAAHGSLVLCCASRMEERKTIGRIDPQALGQFVLMRQGSPESLSAFGDLVKAELESVLSREGPRAYPLYWASFRKTVDLLVETRGADVAQWLTPLINGHHRIPHELLLEHDFPVVDLCRALLHHVPSKGALLWSRFEEHFGHDLFGHPSLAILPLEVPESPQVEALRDLVLDAATVDLHISKIAEVVIEHGRQAWLLRCIERDLEGHSAGRIARALTLAGFLDSTPESDELWGNRLEHPPASGWLSEVFEWSREVYRCNRWAHHWLDQFLSERDRDTAFSYYTLFLACADRRSLSWARRQVSRLAERLPKPWLAHWSLCYPNFVKQIEKADEKNKKTLFGTPIIEHIQAPWL